MGCQFRPQMNALWSVWYCLLTAVVNGYLLYLGISRYSVYQEAKWFPGQYPTLTLSIYIGLHAAAVVLLTLFMAAAGLKVGNFANDGDKLGSMGARRVLELSGKIRCCRGCKSAWQHGPPVAQTLHLSLAFVILLAHSLMSAELFKNDFYKKEEIMTTDDLHFLYNSPHRLNKIVPNATVSLSAANVSPKLLPILMNSKLYGVSLEFLNYFVALLVFAAKYPSVFFHTNKSFSFLFSSHLIIHAIAAIFTLVSFNILYRIHSVSYESEFLPVMTAFLLNGNSTLAAYLANAVLIFFASAVVYGYGYNRYCSSLLSQQGRYRIRKSYPICCEGYSPHIVAIILLISMVACKAPVLYDLMLIYQKQHDPKILSCIVADVTYLFTWILLWLALTLKRDWHFKVRYSAQEVLRILGSNEPIAREFKDSAAVVLCGNETFVTDDPNRRQAILGIVEKARLSQTESDVYWLKPQQNVTPALPSINTNRTAAPIANDDTLRRDTQLSSVGPPEDPNATWKAKNKGYYKFQVSFDYDDEMNLDQMPAGLRNPRMGVGQIQGNPQGNYADFRTSGNIQQQQRFQDDLDAVNPDSVTTTFGTLPSRGSDQQRHRRRADMNDYSLDGRQGRSGSDMAPYATVQKPPRPDQSGNYRTPVVQHQQVPLESNYASRQEYIRPPLNNLDLDNDRASVNDFNVSRASSYSNVPSTHKSQQQNNWESIQKVADGNYMSSGPQRSQINANPYGSANDNYGVLPAKTSSYASVQGGTPLLSNRSRTSYSPAIPENVAVPQQMNKLPNRQISTGNSMGNGGRSPSFERRNDDLIYAPGRSLPINGVGGKMSSFSDAGSDYGGAGGTLTRGGNNSSREVTPVSHNGNGQYGNGMKIYGPSVAQYGHFHPQQQPLGNPQGRKLSNGSGLGVVSPVNMTSPSNLSVGHNGQPKSFGHHERNDSANFSLTSSNESERDPVVTSIV